MYYLFGKLCLIFISWNLEIFIEIFVVFGWIMDIEYYDVSNNMDFNGESIFINFCLIKGF